MIHKKLFFISGLLFVSILVVRIYVGVSTGDVVFTELLAWSCVAYLCFVMSYLYPQFMKKDERAKFIKDKGMKISLFIVLVLFVLISISNMTNVIHLNMMDTFKILISITIFTMSSSWLVLSHRH